MVSTLTPEWVADLRLDLREWDHEIKRTMASGEYDLTEFLAPFLGYGTKVRQSPTY